MRFILPLFLLFISASGMAQNYAGWWQEVDDLTNDGKPKSALEVVDKIHQQAVKDENGPQLIKAVIHEIKFNDQYEEESLVASIERLKVEAEKASQPTQQVLYSLLAEMHWGYYQNNQWRIQKRSATEDGDDNILTWDFKRIAHETDKYYQRSLNNTKALKTPQLEGYEAILTGTKRYREVRPSLYHLLLSRALSFYSSEERNLINFDPPNAYQEEILLGSTDEFLSWKLKSMEGLQPAALTILMYQELLREAKTVSKESLVLENLKRLEFMHNRSSLATADELYEAQLIAMLKQYFEVEVSGEIAYQLASLYQKQGSAVSDVSHSDYWKWKTADSLCQIYIKKFPNSIGARNCKSLSERIQSKEWAMDAEGIILPNKAFRFLLRYRNLDKPDADKWPVYVRVASLDPIEYRNKSRQNYGEKLVRWMKSNSTTVTEKTFEIPNPKDFKSHSIELPLDGLPLGTYVLFAGTDSNLSTGGDAVSFAVVTVSDIAIIKRQNDNGKSVLKVLSRNLGDPIQDAKVELLTLVYDRNNRKNTYELVETLITDENGEATWQAESQNHRGLIADVYHGQDKLISADNVYGYGNKEDVRWNERTHFFLDRAIYRPGQTIQFKGLILRSNGTKVETLQGKSTTIKLYDANGQEVSKLDLKSNEFGTFSGTFIAPTGGLNGSIRIGNESGSHSFRMEEYKRPKFEVKVDNPKGQYQVNDTVLISGSAMSYAGVPLDGAEVKYRVTRTTAFPYRWLCWGWFPQSNPKQVAFGTVTPDAGGVFNVVFQAQPDPLVQSKYKPVFRYKLEVDVTDQSGEMQTGSGTIAVGYHSLNLDISVPSIIEKSELGSYTVLANNLSGEKQNAKVAVDVWELKPNERILRNRMWSNPDQFYLSEIEHKRLLTNEPYAQENDFKTWEKSKNMYHGIVDTEKETAVNIGPLNSLGQGHYLVELTAKDAFGTEVKQRKYYTLIDQKSGVPPYSTTAWFHAHQYSHVPGETLEFYVGSSYKGVDFLIEIEVKDRGNSTNKLVYSENLTVSNEQKKISVPVTEEWRGNGQIHVSAVRNNAFLEWTKTIMVPYANKQLDVKLETFRKEMSPDDKEEWTLKITDKAGKAVSAEYLTTMYDASLDVLAANNWALQPYGFLNARKGWKSNSFKRAQVNTWDRNWKRYPSSALIRDFENINWFGYRFARGGFYNELQSVSISSNRASRGGLRKTMALSEEESDASDSRDFAFAEADAVAIETRSMPASLGNANGGLSNPPKEIKMRSDFSETVFFNPHLKTDENGSIKLSFTAPQSLTRWKFMGLATTQDLKIGTITEEVVTRKQLMLTPNYPRFLREDDKLVFQVKVNVLDSTILTANASLELMDALTGNVLNKKFEIRNLKFVNGSVIGSWEFDVPEGISAIKFTTKAWSEKHSDGEEKTIPVLSNRMLVTEAMPLPVRGKGTHNFTFTKLKDNTSKTLRNHSLTLEFTPNPVWLAVLSLPYMMEYPYECSEQIFSRYYANAIGTHLANSDPKIKSVFDQWKSAAQNKEGDAFLSELEKNPELKQALLRETPWVRDAQNETEQRRRIGELFDVNRMETELAISLKKLKQNQRPDGGWGWFNGLSSDMFITRHIVAGFGKMRKMGVWKKDAETESMLKKAVAFLDKEMVIYYDRRALKDKDYRPGWIDLHMTYTRSFWLEDFALSGKAKTTYNIIVKTIRLKWTKLDASQKGLAAVILNRSGFESDAQKVVVSLRETVLTSKEFGAYWAVDKGYYWYQAPIENHVMILEAFDEIAKDADMVREMNIWLLKQKQTQSWETTKATAEACYALLSTGTPDFETQPLVSIQMGNETIDPRTDKDLKTEAGTGYFKTNWTKNSISPEMGSVTVTKHNDGVAWGAVYWQYFEDLDKITDAQDNPIKMTREVMLLEDTKDGQIMKSLDDNNTLSVGDRVRVKIILETDRHMEYVHLKDMRAASFEPRKQISGPEYQEGMSYYRSTTDAAMNFFFGYLPKGTFVFEYDLNVTQAGTFSNGISQLQCMYAPDFTTHSEGMKLEIGR
ncbi:MAG: hypothetical protein ACI9EQ_000460 [Bacteroidia bacterium]|jgi:uncharacterized protein YfaS (alpha-2-macroglobulin family)